jgi:hypothetical protein
MNNISRAIYSFYRVADLEMWGIQYIPNVQSDLKSYIEIDIFHIWYAGISGQISNTQSQLKKDLANEKSM